MPKKGSNLRAKDLRIDHAAQMRIVEQAGIGDWTHPGEAMDPPEIDLEMSLIMDMAARLSKVLQFVSDGREGSTMEMRIWAVLYVLRPDLIKGETIAHFAARMKVSSSRIKAFVGEFRALFPGVEFRKSLRVSNREVDDPTTPTPSKASL
jgi:hypothetical protein